MKVSFPFDISSYMAKETLKMLFWKHADGATSWHVSFRQRKWQALADALK